MAMGRILGKGKILAMRRILSKEQILVMDKVMCKEQILVMDRVMGKDQLLNLARTMGQEQLLALGREQILGMNRLTQGMELVKGSHKHSREIWEQSQPDQWDNEGCNKKGIPF
ncbi:hypothetical protein REPUB_Repub04eG0064300 [Reevesia pubescens]